MKWTKLLLMPLIMTQLLSGCYVSNQELGIVACEHVLADRPDAEQSWQDYPALKMDEAFHIALESGPTFYPNEANISLISEDLALIRSNYPSVEISQINASPCASNKLVFGTDHYTISLMKSGLYDNWDNLNEKYGAKDLTIRSDANVAELRFKRNFNAMTLYEIYEEANLNGISYIDIEPVTGSNQDICFEQNGAQRVYVFWQRSVDCPDACFTEVHTGFKIDENNKVSELGTFFSTDLLVPNWYRDLKRCPALLEGSLALKSEY